MANWKILRFSAILYEIAKLINFTFNNHKKIWIYHQVVIFARIVSDLVLVAADLKLFYVNVDFSSYPHFHLPFAAVGPRSENTPTVAVEFNDAIILLKNAATFYLEKQLKKN